jgi:hypothetical protein
MNINKNAQGHCNCLAACRTIGILRAGRKKGAEIGKEGINRKAEKEAKV